MAVCPTGTVYRVNSVRRSACVSPKTGTATGGGLERRTQLKGAHKGGHGPCPPPPYELGGPTEAGTHLRRPKASSIDP